MDPHDRHTSQEVVEGVLVIGFVGRGSGGADLGATLERDVAEFGSRLEALGGGGRPEFAVVDFSNYGCSGTAGGRCSAKYWSPTNVSRLGGGGLLACHHPYQFNPDLQHFFYLDKVVEVYRTRREALDAVRARRGI